VLPSCSFVVKNKIIKHIGTLRLSLNNTKVLIGLSKNNTKVLIGLSKNNTKVLIGFSNCKMAEVIYFFLADLTVFLPVGLI
jgi:hypothetical protein